MKTDSNLKERTSRAEREFQLYMERTYKSNSSVSSYEIEKPRPVTKDAGSVRRRSGGDTVIRSLADIIPDMKDMRRARKASLLQKTVLFFVLLTRRENLKRLSCILVPAFLVLFLFLNVLTPSSELSEKENRSLAQFPEMSVSSITSGKFMSEFEKYISDQFVFRNHFVNAKRRYEKLAGKKENHNILICDDGYLIENTSELTEENLAANIKAINDLASVKRYNVSVAIVPTAYEVLKDKLPNHAYVNSYGKLQDKLSKDLKEAVPVDTAPALDKYKDKYIYYHSDHHQTALGSYIVYTALGKQVGYKPNPYKSYTVTKVSEGFCGTAWSNSGFAPTEEDYIYKFTPSKKIKSEVTFPMDNKSMSSLYNEEMLTKKDKYSYYLDGNHAITEIKSKCGNKKKLAIIKDSYAHSIAPFLASHYGEIYMIDLRYFNDDIYEYLYENNIKDVLFLYNQNTFMTDTNLSKISGFAKTSSFTNVPVVSYGEVPEQELVDASYFDDAAFVGDSLTIGIANFSGFNSHFLCVGGLNTRTLGNKLLSGNKSVLDAIKEMDHLGKIYIMLGTNEIAYEDMESFMQRYSDFIDAVRKEHPNVIVYIESILPVTKHVSNTTSIKNDSITEYNERLLQMAKDKQCYYIDCHSHFEDSDGALPDDIGSDGIHLGPVKYKELADYFRSHAVPVSGVVKIENSTKKVFAGGGKADTDAIAQKVLKKIKFKDDLARVADTLVVSSYGVTASDICSASLYLGGGATAEEIAVFEAKSVKVAKNIETLAKERVENKKKDFENYIPAEMTKLSKPVIVRKGKVVVLCIADKVSKADITSCIK